MLLTSPLHYVRNLSILIIAMFACNLLRCKYNLTQVQNRSAYISGISVRF